MKKIALATSVLVLVIATMAFTPTNLSTDGNFEGVITFSSTVDNPRAGRMNHKGSNTMFYVKGNKVKIVVDGPTMTNTTLIDNANPDNTITLITANGKKYELQNDNSSKLPDPVINYTDETKIIAGYTCHKAEVTMFLNQDKTNSLKEDVYYTKDITNNFYGTQCRGLKGFPLEWSTKKPDNNPNAITTHSVAITVNKQTVSDEEFKVPPGYKSVTMEEMSQDIRANGK